MAMEPITLFSWIADLRKVAERLREIAPKVEIDGPDDRWRKAVVTFKKGWRKKRITFTHDPAYEAEPNWSNQMAGMRGYFSRFPDSERKSRALKLMTSFRLSLGTLFEPDCEPEGDPRLGVLFAVAEVLDGVLFTPSSLRDAHGRILFSAAGEDEEDPDAAWPRVLGEVSVSDPLGAAMHDASRPKRPEEQDEDAMPPTAKRVVHRALALAGPQSPRSRSGGDWLQRTSCRPGTS